MSECRMNAARGARFEDLYGARLALFADRRGRPRACRNAAQPFFSAFSISTRMTLSMFSVVSGPINL